MEEWGPNHRDRDRVIRDFELCCKLSNLPTNDSSVGVALLGQLANSGLGPGSCDTYIGHVTKRYRMTDVSKAASARHADYEARHAADIDDDTLWKYVLEASPLYRRILWLMYIAGLRAISIRYLRRRRVHIPKRWKSADIEVVVKIDKTRKKAALRAIMSLPKTWEWIQPPPHKDDIKFFQDGPADERLFEGITATNINDELRRISKKLSLPRPTSYSFRRAFINRVIPLVTSKKKLTEYSLHFSVSTVDAFYKRTQDDISKMSKS